MKRTITLTFQFDDDPWFDERENQWHPTDAHAYAMDQVNGVLTFIGYTVDFAEARLDGQLLADQNGNAPEEIKRLEKQYPLFMSLLGKNKGEIK